MNVNTIVSLFLNSIFGNMHKARANALRACVESVLSGSFLSVTSIGRGISTHAYEKHSIKRADRLCSNCHLSRSKIVIYKHIVTLLTSHLKTPIIHVDWSDLNKQKTLFLIRASLSFEGRALTLYEEVHSLETKETAKTHSDFLVILKLLLPSSSQPIIVTDAGFKRPWFKAVRALGWHFMGRVRGRVCLSKNEEKGALCKTLFPLATSVPQLMKNGYMGNVNPYKVNIILYKAKSKGRVAKTKKGHRQQSNYSRKNARRAHDPWILVTSLPARQHLAKRAVGIYEKRMQIEEAFRDSKSERYGLGMSLHGTKQLQRMSILVLIGTIAHTLLMLLGLLAEKQGLHHRFQANTIKERRVLSYLNLGLRIYQKPLLRISIDGWRNMIGKILDDLSNNQRVTV